MVAQLNQSRLNTARLNNSTLYPYSFNMEMRRKRGSKPITKVEFIDLDGNVTDISRWFLEGANLEQVKERAVDEIQAGDFDIILNNKNRTFSEYVFGSLFYGIQYHGAKIRVSQGFILPDASVVYEQQGVGYIDQLIGGGKEARITLRCRDLLRRIMDQKLNVKPEGSTPVMDADNTGDGRISAIDTLPFKAKNETWTLTCTTPGGNNVAIFSVVGSVSGTLSTATSGVEYSTGTGAGGIKFKISAGSTNWALSDVITFTTYQYPEWNLVNAVKIVWSVLTGYNWDTDTQEPWSDLVLDLDHTKSDANVDLDYETFVTVMEDVETIGAFDLKGYAAFEEDAIAFIQNILTMFIGSLFTGGDGRIKIKSYIPIFGTAETSFSDAKKVRMFGYNRTVDEIINAITVRYKQTDNWEFSDEQPELDGAFVKKNATSIAAYKEIGAKFEFRWYTEGGQHAQDLALKILSKFADPPVNIDFQTGMDAIRTSIGDVIKVTDTKYGIQDFVCEVTRVQKNFDQRPTSIFMRVRRDAVVDVAWAMVGSEEDEGDGISPQADDYDSANDVDKLFGYFSADGEDAPDYRIF